MEKRRLGDIASYINGYAFKPEDRGTEGLPIIRIQDLTGNAYDIGFYNGDYPSRIEINNGDVLISWSASLGVYVWNKGKALLNQHIFKVAFDKIDVNKQYFVFAVKHKLKEMESKTHGATMKHIVKKDFDNTLVPFPSLERQAEVSDILSRVEGIIVAREQELSDLDMLIKARFVEMFGDLKTNPKKWDTIELGALTSVGSSKRIFEKEYVPAGVPFYRTKEIVELSKGNSISTELFISEERFSEIKRQYGAPKSGDLLISAVGTIGVIWIVDGEKDFYFKDGNLIKVDGADSFNSIYMKNVLEVLIADYKNQMSAGTAYAALTISGLSKMKVFDAPMELQNEFAEFVKQVDKSKVVVQKALDEAQLLFDSLMQEYFG